MWSYQKRLQYPVNIKNTDPRLAQYIVAQYGGPNGELSASLRYLSQRFSMPNSMTKGLLTDIGTEELDPLCYRIKKYVICKEIHDPIKIFPNSSSAAVRLFGRMYASGSMLLAASLAFSWLLTFSRILLIFFAYRSRIRANSRCLFRGLVRS